MSLRAVMKKCACPAAAEILRPRAVALTVAAIGAAQLVAASFGMGIPCAFHWATGCPCPGCGLTRSVLALLRGHFTESVMLHPFGPPLLLVLAIALIAALIPQHARDRLVAWLARVESRTALFPAAVIALLLVWALRITGALPLAPV